MLRESLRVRERERRISVLSPTRALSPGSSKSRTRSTYVVELGKQSGMTLVVIQGSGIVNANCTLVLGLVWLFMRMSITKTLSKLAGGGGKFISDMEMVKWADGQGRRRADVRSGASRIRVSRRASSSWMCWKG